MFVCEAFVCDFNFRLGKFVLFIKVDVEVERRNMYVLLLVRNWEGGYYNGGWWGNRELLCVSRDPFMTSSPFSPQICGYSLFQLPFFPFQTFVYVNSHMYFFFKNKSPCEEDL